MSIFDDLYAHDNQMNQSRNHSESYLMTAEEARNARKKAILNCNGELMGKIKTAISNIISNPARDTRICLSVENYHRDAIEEIIRVLKGLGYNAEYKTGSDYRDGAWAQLVISF